MSSLEKHLQTSHNAAPNLVRTGLEEEFKVSKKGRWVSSCANTPKTHLKSSKSVTLNAGKRKCENKSDDVATS